MKVYDLVVPTSNWGSNRVNIICGVITKDLSDPKMKEYLIISDEGYELVVYGDEIEVIKSLPTDTVSFLDAQKPYTILYNICINKIKDMIKQELHKDEL